MLVVIVCLIVVLYVVWIGLSRLFSFLVLQGFVLVPGVLCQCCCSCVCVCLSQVLYAAFVNLLSWCDCLFKQCVVLVLGYVVQCCCACLLKHCVMLV